MPRVEYYRRDNGRVPAQIWLDAMEKVVAAGILAKIAMLESEGLALLAGTLLKHIAGQKNLFEIRYCQYRLLVYHENRNDTFIALHGFKKQKMNERNEIDKGIALMHEYLSGAER